MIEFDHKAADHAQRFIETLCTFTKGKGVAGSPFKLEDWQRDEVVRPAFGWKRPDGTRLYRRVYLEIPRKNGKTHLSAALSLYLLFADGEDGAEVMAAAADKEQAKICYNIAKQMVLNSDRLSAEAEVMQRAIYYGKRDSSFKAISHESDTKHGYDISGLVIDELHAHKDAELKETLEAGMVSREQPLTFILTTAGVADDSNPGYDMHKYAMMVKEGHVTDETLLPVIYGADEEDDPFKRETWKKANPNFGISVREDHFMDMTSKARVDPATLETLKRLHLNIWTNSWKTYISSESWDRCSSEPVEGAKCWIGLDLSSTTDFTALVCVFEDFSVIPFFFIPEETVERRVIRDQIRGWWQGGNLELIEGEVIDYSVIHDRILSLCEKYDVQEVAYDPYAANRVIPELIAQGVECVAFQQGWKSMSPAMKETKRLIVKGELKHGGHPVLSWMNSNLHYKEDEAGNVQPHKGKSRDRIDGMVAMFMAVYRAVYSEKENEDQIQDIKFI